MTQGPTLLQIAELMGITDMLCWGRSHTLHLSGMVSRIASPSALTRQACLLLLSARWFYVLLSRLARGSGVNWST